MPNISTSLLPNNNFRINHVRLFSPLGLMMDLTSELINFTMVETIDDITSGTIVIQNRTNITGVLKNLTGQEKIEISFASGNGNQGGVRTTISKSFRCNNIGYVSDCIISSPNSAIKIELVSNFNIVNETNRISKVYDISKSVSDIVTDIAETFYPNTPLNVETTGNLNYPLSLQISKPYTVLKNLINLAISSDFQSSDFRLFENANGLNFVTTGNLLSEEPKFTFGIPPSGGALSAGTGNFIPITDLDAFMLADPRHNYGAATFGTNVMTTSVIDKEFDFTYINRTDFDKIRPYMNDKSTLAGNESVVKGQETFNHNVLYSKDSIYSSLANSEFYRSKTDQNIYDFFGYQNQEETGLVAHKANIDVMEKTRLNSKRIMVSAAGWTDLTAGSTVYLNMMNIDNADRNKSALNTNLSGKWLITAIKYNITLTSFNCDYTLISDSNITG